MEDGCIELAEQKGKAIKSFFTMSRPPHFPPCYPPLSPQKTHRDDSFFTQSCRFPSQDLLFGEAPRWVGDVLSDSEKSSVVPPLRRACSDSDAILDVLTTSQKTIFPIEEEDLVSNDEANDSSNATRGGETRYGIEASYVYGPNSPRQKSRLTNSESSMLNAILQNLHSNPLQYLTFDASNGVGDASGAWGYPDQDKPSKRHLGQRSRARKLQYIAELERTVDTHQNMGADLAIRVASLFQLRATLSMENKQLRRQIASLQQEKLIKNGQMHSLKKEVVRLKLISRHHCRSRGVSSCTETSSFQAGTSGNNWQMLDMSKLSLNGSLVAPKKWLWPLRTACPDVPPTGRQYCLTLLTPY